MRYVLFISVFMVSCGADEDSHPAHEILCDGDAWADEISRYPSPPTWRSREIRGGFFDSSDSRCGADEFRIVYFDGSGRRIAQIDRPFRLMRDIDYRLFDAQGRIEFRALLNEDSNGQLTHGAMARIIYDDAGREVAYLVDEPDDGYVEALHFADSLARAGLSASPQGDDADGFDVCHLRQYREESDAPHDFAWDAIYEGCLVDVFVLRTDDQIALHGTYTNEWEDGAARGFVWWTEIEYTPDGKPSQSTAYFRHAFASSGAYEHRQTWRYDSGELVRYEVETNGDDVPDYLETYVTTRSADGVVQDVFQGFAEVCALCAEPYRVLLRHYLTRRYLPSGQLVQVDGYRYSWGGLFDATPLEPDLNGPFANSVVWRYIAHVDAAGRTIRERVFDGPHNVFSDVPFEELRSVYNERGLLTRETYAIDRIAPSNLWIGMYAMRGTRVYTYDEHGRIIGFERDGGAHDVSVRYEYVNE